jgi:outer membrane protein TolC
MRFGQRTAQSLAVKSIVGDRLEDECYGMRRGRRKQSMCDHKMQREYTGAIKPRGVVISTPLLLSLIMSLMASAVSGQGLQAPPTSPSVSVTSIQTGSTSQPYTGSNQDTVSLTMHEAVKLALKQNPRLLAARIEALESKQSAKVARSVYLPKATLGLEDQMQRLNLATIFGQESAPYSVGPSSNVQIGATFDVPIIAVSAWSSYQAEKRRAESSQQQAADVQESIASIVVAQYLSLLRSKATEQAVQSRIDLATVLLRLANDQLAQGTGTSTDALRANVELHVEKENLVRAQSQTRAYGYGLAQVLGLKENQQVVAAESLTAADD